MDNFAGNIIISNSGINNININNIGYDTEGGFMFPNTGKMHPPFFLPHCAILE